MHVVFFYQCFFNYIYIYRLKFCCPLPFIIKRANNACIRTFCCFFLFIIDKPKNAQRPSDPRDLSLRLRWSQRYDRYWSLRFQISSGRVWFRGLEPNINSMWMFSLCSLAGLSVMGSWFQQRDIHIWSWYDTPMTDIPKGTRTNLSKVKGNVVLSLLDSVDAPKVCSMQELNSTVSHPSIGLPTKLGFAFCRIICDQLQLTMLSAACLVSVETAVQMQFSCLMEIHVPGLIKYSTGGGNISTPCSTSPLQILVSSYRA